jgi:hypothetical protein
VRVVGTRTVSGSSLDEHEGAVLVEGEDGGKRFMVLQACCTKGQGQWEGEQPARRTYAESRGFAFVKGCDGFGDERGRIGEGESNFNGKVGECAVMMILDLRRVAVLKELVSCSSSSSQEPARTR